MSDYNKKFNVFLKKMGIKNCMEASSQLSIDGFYEKYHDFVTHIVDDDIMIEGTYKSNIVIKYKNYDFNFYHSRDNNYIMYTLYQKKYKNFAQNRCSLITVDRKQGYVELRELSFSANCFTLQFIDKNTDDVCGKSKLDIYG